MVVDLGEFVREGDGYDQHTWDKILKELGHIVVFKKEAECESSSQLDKQHSSIASADALNFCSQLSSDGGL